MEKRRSAAEQFDLSAFLPFWDELAGAQKAALSNRPVVAFSDGEKILLPLAERTGFLLVLKGALRVYISSEGGREFTLYKVPAGGMCSILPIDGAGMPNIVADGPTAVVHITTAIILQILAYLPAVSDYYLACMSGNLQSVLENIEHSFFGTLKSSVARLILENCPAGGDTVKVTHEQLANHIGTTREVVSREIEGFHELGLIAAGRGKITILDRAGLQSLTCP